MAATFLIPILLLFSLLTINGGHPPLMASSKTLFFPNTSFLVLSSRVQSKAFWVPELGFLLPIFPRLKAQFSSVDAIFLLWRVLPRDFMFRNFTISVDNIKSGRIHTLLTSAFSHINMEHIGSNMLGLYFFGSSIGSVFGPEYLLKLYVAGAVVGSIFYLVHHAYLANSYEGTFRRDPSRTPGLGASGAVNAILLLDIFLFPRKTIMFDFFIPVPAILLGVFLVGKDVLRILEGDQNISGSAHLGGAVVAAVAWLRVTRKLRF
ncbi:RHOMBOID-like protein 12, mitochondrial isoform X2 [Chenopodium quinoa]|uniref:RHOMBOID-like protein 12, mitochondrial isoform X2 n=1 Tax=Chenopodium quinoa TaxID=63459 RepID=UPI000B78C83F|nr:RHOMBOID-like protein 12, mitochondrial isoform X2 [Chenopodium quinoa]